MMLTRLAIFVLLITSAVSVLAQRPKSESRFFRTCDLVGPLTKLEEFDARWESVIIRGATPILTVVAGRNGTARVDAIELRDESNGTRATGVLVELRDPNRQDTSRLEDQGRVFIDYEEIDPLTAAWDRLVRTDDTITKFTNFESHYRSRGDMEISVFRATPGGAVAASVSGGVCNRVRILLSLDDLIKLRWMIVQAKAKLDEIK
jgi:hypothetical protein